MVITISKINSTLHNYLLVILLFVTHYSISIAQANFDSNFSVRDKKNLEDKVRVIIDADYTFEQSLEGSTIPISVKKDLELITVTYYGFDSKLHQGQLLVNKEVSADLKEIFSLIRRIKFPIEKVIPLVKYDWSDEKSMEDNNTSSFNFRFVSGSKILSLHANGLAIDINPRQNPYVKHGISSPAGSEYNLSVKGTIAPDSEIVQAFKKRGWTWGGDWKSLKDYQHFQKETQ